MLNLLGEYDISLDAKGRFLLPSSFRKQFPEGSGDKYVIKRGFEKCLTLYPVETWEETAAKVSKLNDFNPKVRKFKRLFLNGASMLEVDSAGRLLIPKRLLEYAGITKDMTFVSQGNKVELWDKDTYSAYLDDHSDESSDLAEEVAGGGYGDPFENL